MAPWSLGRYDRWKVAEYEHGFAVEAEDEVARSSLVWRSPNCADAHRRSLQLKGQWGTNGAGLPVPVSLVGSA